MGMLNEIKDLFKDSLKVALATAIFIESFNLVWDTTNLIERPKAKIEYLAKEMREMEEKTFGIKFKENPKIITSSHRNVLYTLNGIKDNSQFSRMSYLEKGIILSLYPFIGLSSGNHVGQYHHKNNIIFINGGYITLFCKDDQLKGVIAHEEAHNYIINQIRGFRISDDINEGLADYMTKKTLEERSIHYDLAYKKEYEYVSELMKKYKSIDEFLENVKE